MSECFTCTLVCVHYVCLAPEEVRSGFWIMWNCVVDGWL